MHSLVLVLCFFLLSFTTVNAEQAVQQSETRKLPSESSEVKIPEEKVSDDKVSKDKVPASASTSLAPISPSKDSKPQSNYEPINSWPVAIGTLFLMILCIVALAWFARRFNGLNIVKNRDMEVLSTLSVGAREKITLVKVKGKTILLGVTSQQISQLHAFDADELLDDQGSIENETTRVKSEFSETLKRFMNKPHGDMRKGEDFSQEERS